MNTYLKYNNIAITQYFELNILLGKWVDRSKLFESIKTIFRLRDEEADVIFSFVCDEDIDELENIDKYNRTMRYIEYAKMHNLDTNISEDREFVLLCKGAAFKNITRLIKRIGSPASMWRTREVLMDRAADNDFLACKLMGIMLLFGLAVDRDINFATKLLKKAARWNDATSMLALMTIDSDDKILYASMFSTLIDRNPTLENLRYITESFNPELLEENSEVKLISRYKTFTPGDDVLIDEQIIRIVYSKRISYEDKKTILFSSNKALVSAINSYPIINDDDVTEDIKDKTLDLKNLKRKAETKEVEMCIKMQNNDGPAVSRPLLLVCPDLFVANEYSRGIENLTGKRFFVNYSVKNMGPKEFIQGFDNFVIRGLMNKNRASAIFVISDIEDINPDYVQGLCKIIDHKERENFRLFDANVGFDIADSIFVLFAKNLNIVDNRIKEMCQIIELESVSKEEKESIIRSTVSELCVAYGLNVNQVKDGVVEKLFNLSHDEYSIILSDVMRKKICIEDDINDVTIEVRDIEERLGNNVKQSMGFRIGGRV